MKEELVERLYSWLAEGKRKPPHTLQLYLTHSACNLDCVYCWRRAKDHLSRNQISQEEYLSLIDQAAKLGVKMVDLTGGGEPLMSDSFEAVINRVKERGMEGELVTNGSLFNDNLVREMVAIGWDCTVISLDSTEREKQNKLRGNGSYKKIIRSLRQFKKWKHRLDTEKPEVHLAPVLSNRNYAEIPQFIQLADKFEVNHVFFQPLMVHTAEMSKYKIDSDNHQELKQAMEQGRALSQKLGVKNNLDQCKLGEVTRDSGKTRKNLRENQEGEAEILNIACYQPWYLMKIFSVTKTAGPCMTSEKYAESIEENGLEDIWYGKKANRLRERLREGDVPNFCENCCGGNVIINQELREKLEGS